MFDEEAEAFASSSITDKENEIAQIARDWGPDSLSPEEKRLWSGIRDRQISRAIGFKAGAEYVYKEYLEWHPVDKEPLPAGHYLVECKNGSISLVHFTGKELISVIGERPRDVFRWKKINLN